MEPQLVYRRSTLGYTHDWVAQKSGTPYTPVPFVRNAYIEYRHMPVSHYNDYDMGTQTFKTGNEWFKVSVITRKYSMPRVSVYRPQWGLAYDGHFAWIYEEDRERSFAYLPHGGDAVKTLANLRLYGAEAWNLLRPDKPIFSLGVEVGELKDILKMKDDLSNLRSKGRRTKDKRSWYSYAGQWYLGIQFGYLPIYRTIVGFIRSLNEVEKHYKQAIRDAGKPIRRKRELKHHAIDDTVTTSTFLPSGYGYDDVNPTFVTQCYASGSRTYTKSVRTESRMWASARFRYILPSSPNKRVSEFITKSRILGFRLTPDLLYQLMPWSWFIDYFTDLGEVVKSWSSGFADNLYAEYFFLMRSHKITVKESCTFLVRTNYSGTSTTRVTVSKEIIYSSKQRIKASPFGFGITDVDLNLHQQAILGALGLSKLP